MSSDNSVNSQPIKTEFLSTKEAANFVPYSREYIGRLAREKKIRAKFKNRRWLVDVDSVKTFCEDAKFEEAILMERLREERQSEQLAAEYIFLINQKATPTSSLGLHAVALCITFALVVAVPTPAFLLHIASNQTALLSHSVQYSAPAMFADPTEKTVSLTMTSGILLLPEHSPVGSVDPAPLFSDEVEIITQPDGTKFVRLMREGAIVDMPFVHVPARKEFSELDLVSNNNDSLF